MGQVSGTHALECAPSQIGRCMSFEHATQQLGGEFDQAQLNRELCDRTCPRFGLCHCHRLTVQLTQVHH